MLDGNLSKSVIDALKDVEGVEKLVFNTADTISGLRYYVGFEVFFVRFSIMVSDLLRGRRLSNELAVKKQVADNILEVSKILLAVANLKESKEKQLNLIVGDFEAKFDEKSRLHKEVYESSSFLKEGIDDLLNRVSYVNSDELVACLGPRACVTEDLVICEYVDVYKDLYNKHQFKKDQLEDAKLQISKLTLLYNTITTEVALLVMLYEKIKCLSGIAKRIASAYSLMLSPKFKKISKEDLIFIEKVESSFTRGILPLEQLLANNKQLTYDLRFFSEALDE